MPLPPLPRAWRLAVRRTRPAKRARADIEGPLPMWVAGRGGEQMRRQTNVSSLRRRGSARPG
eukprot:461478-Pleurochrysis_carterae.AAC.1